MCVCVCVCVCVCHAHRLPHDDNVAHFDILYTDGRYKVSGQVIDKGDSRILQIRGILSVVSIDTGLR